MYKYLQRGYSALLRSVCTKEMKGTCHMGLFDSGAFKVTEWGLDATWYKQQVISLNIANISTPDFKAKTVSFQLELENACKCRYHTGSGDGRHDHTEDGTGRLRAVTTYETNTNQTLNGNNVDIEKESNALLDAQYQYSTMIDYLISRYSMIRTAIGK